MAKIRLNLKQTIKDSGPREFFLDRIIKAKKFTVGAEVGVRFGRTLFHLLDKNPNLKMYAIDKDVSQFYNDKIKKKYGDRLVVIEGNSWDSVKEISEDLDFVFIDAGHGYKSVCKDIQAYRDKVKSSGWVLGHDIDFPAVNRAVEELIQTYKIGPDNVWAHSKDDNYNVSEI